MTATRLMGSIFGDFSSKVRDKDVPWLGLEIECQRDAVNGLMSWILTGRPTRCYLYLF